jgi:hypothetical protein
MTQAKKRRKPDLGLLRCSTVPVVYRVQDSMGRGPWKPGFSSQWVEDRPESEFEALQPIHVQFPSILSQLRPGFAVGVGCESLEQLRRWITAAEWETLKNWGYSCCVIQPDRIVAKSDIQCVFECRKPIRKCVKKRIKLHP